jgi:hypothetical protein
MKESKNAVALCETSTPGSTPTMNLRQGLTGLTRLLTSSGALLDPPYTQARDPVWVAANSKLENPEQLLLMLDVEITQLPSENWSGLRLRLCVWGSHCGSSDAAVQVWRGVCERRGHDSR